jgi:hypothetical protein
MELRATMTVLDLEWNANFNATIAAVIRSARLSGTFVLASGGRQETGSEQH